MPYESYDKRLAAHLGLPYAFASHFAPQALREAVARYRHDFTPSDQLSEPYVIAGANAVAADTEDDAQAELERVVRSRVARFLVKDRELSDEQVDQLVASPQGQQVVGMMRYTFAGTGPQVADQLRDFAVQADADEIMLAFASADVADRVRAIELVAEAAVS